MNRCAPSLFALALACAGTLATLAPVPASAQAALQRKFTKSTLRGKILFGNPPAITLNGTVMALAPGFRVHSTTNLLVLPSRLVGGTYTVNYTLDHQDRVYEVWILTDAEVANKPWPTTTAQAQSWTFDATSQTWTKS